MTSETSRQSRNFCLQNKTSLASLATLGSVRPNYLASVLGAYSLPHSSYGAGRGRDYRTWIWPPRCVPGCGRSGDRRHARYAHGHDACTFAGGEEARQKAKDAGWRKLL
jgi:hypothetical protein